jgi:hypothetical protein
MKIFALFFVAALALAGCQTTGQTSGQKVAKVGACQGVSMPDYRVIPSVGNMAPKFASFVGVWYGQWDGEFPSCLVVTNVQGNGIATIVYGWPDGSSIFTSTIQDGKIRFGREVKLVFTITDANVIDAVLFNSGSVQYATFRKVAKK